MPASKRSDLTKLDAGQKLDLKIIAGDILVKAIKDHLGKSKTPVSDGAFKVKKADKTNSKLFDEGDLWASIEWENSKNGIKVGVFDDAETPKAFNHTTGDTLPTREMIPKGNGSFKKTIIDKVKAALSEELDKQNE